MGRHHHAARPADSDGAWLAEFERHLIVARISEGRKRASAWRTVRPAPQADAAQRREAIARRDEGLETLTDIAAATT